MSVKFNEATRLQNSVAKRGQSLAESKRWKPYTYAIREGYKAKNKVDAPEHLVQTTAILLENTYQSLNRMDEVTRQINTGSFIDYGFEVISTVVPNLIANDLVSTQPLEARFGTIFYLDYIYGNDKGSIKQGDIMNSPFTGVTGNTSFSGQEVEGEVLGTGDGTKTTFTTTLMYTPVKSGSAKIMIESEPAVVLSFKETANGVDTYTDEAGTTIATVNLTDGSVKVTAAAAPAADVQVVMTYDYDMDQTTQGFSQVNLDLKAISLEAKPRKLRAQWLLDAGYDLQTIKGINAEEELVLAMSSEIKHEIDTEILNQMYRLAGHTGYEWDAQLPGASGISYIDYKRTLLDTLTEMSNDIFISTKRTGANFIVGGVNFCNIVETLPDFEAVAFESKQVNGAHYIGLLAGKWKVYKNPFYAPDIFVMGFKGSTHFDAGFVYAPFMPLYTTPTTILDDFVFRKGLATSYATKMLNNKLYAKGKITNFAPERVQPNSPIITKSA